MPLTEIYNVLKNIKKTKVEVDNVENFLLQKRVANNNSDIVVLKLWYSIFLSTEKSKKNLQASVLKVFIKFFIIEKFKFHFINKIKNNTIYIKINVFVPFCFDMFSKKLNPSRFILEINILQQKKSTILVFNKFDKRSIPEII